MRPRKVWLITDTHWFHDWLVESKCRPDDYGTRIIKNCQRVIMPHDTLIHLGDVILGRHNALGSIMSDIPGTKILVRGNHDRDTDSWYTRHGFAFVCDQFAMKGVLFTHKPVVIPPEFRLNVHGHFHDDGHRRDTAEFQAIMEPRHRLLAIEATDYKPVDFESFCR